MLLSIEIFAVVLNLVYLVLLIKENIWCWPSGILASILSIILFLDAKLYSEVVLYIFYVIIGIYGWLVWSGKLSAKKQIEIQKWKVGPHLIAFSVGVIGMLGLGYYFGSKTDADKPYLDAFSTSFSFVASFMEAHKVLSAWGYWIVLNLFSIWLYYSRGLSIYAGLMAVYAIASVWGLLEWRKRFNNHVQEAT